MSIKEGAVILMLGTKDEVPLEPSQEERPKFIEDMNESELATAVRKFFVVFYVSDVKHGAIDKFYSLKCRLV